MERLGAMVLLLIAGCEPAPTPAKSGGCAQDYECRSGPIKAYCVDAKCVECRTDDDCKLPKMCGQLHTCFVP